MSVQLLPVDQRPVLRSKEVAALLGLSVSEVNRMAAAGKFPGARRGGLGDRGPWLIPKRDVPGLEAYDTAVAYRGLRALERGAA